LCKFAFEEILIEAFGKGVTKAVCGKRRLQIKKKKETFREISFLYKAFVPKTGVAKKKGLKL